MASQQETVRTRSAEWRMRVALAAVLLALALLGPRTYILQRAVFLTWDSSTRVLASLLKVIAGGAYDAALVAALFALVLASSIWLPRASKALYYGFVVVATFVLTAAVANTAMLKTLGRPFNYQWLYYSGFLQSVDAKEAILTHVNWPTSVAAVGTVLLYGLITLVIGRRTEAWKPLMTNVSWIVPATLMALLAWSAGGHWCATSRGWSYAMLANPVYEFAQSWLFSDTHTSLFTMKTTFSEAEFAPVGSAKHGSPRPSGIRHVFVYVLESTPAEYLGVYGSKYGATPNLDRWSRHAAVLENIYAHAPATNKSLFSLISAVYPWISYRSEIEEKSAIVLPSIVSELGRHGYATGFFASGDLSFQSAGRFLQARGFDAVQDYKGRRTTRKIFRSERWPFLDGSDEISTVEAATDWFGQQLDADKSVFAILWTNMTHYPYFVEEVTHQFGPEENRFNQYLNALHYVDRGFGVLMKWIQERKIADDTLVVVVGDHGEAFGRHNQVSHAGGIYDENCHVPLLFINSRLFRDRREPVIGGLVDVAPTIMEILGRPPAENWQGRSLFSRSRANRTYFFSAWSDYLFGYREGNMKFLYNASGNRYEVYDLSADPMEQTNLAASHKGQISHHVMRLATWVQVQDRLFARPDGQF
jgi:lipoteichoic acid synthase